MFWYEDFWIITLIIQPVVYILGKSKHLIDNDDESFKGLIIMPPLNLLRGNGLGK